MERKELYITALIFNLNRFIEETVISHRTFIADSLPECTILSQRIIGDYTAVTGIFGDPDTMMKFAAQYSKFEVTRYDSLFQELLGDFLNLHNGLFVVNLSDSESI